MFIFQNLSVYNRAKKINTNLILFLNRKKIDDKSILYKIRRSSLSIVLNIAEGSGRYTKKDFNRFLRISRGSLFETVSILDVMKDLDLLNKEEYFNFYNEYEEISKLFSGLIKSNLK